MATYTVWFCGVLYSQHRTKGAALDALYRTVDASKHHQSIMAIRGSVEARKRADQLGRTLSVLASTIPDARKSPSSSRYVFQAPECLVRRDAKPVI